MYVKTVSYWEWETYKKEFNACQLPTPRAAINKEALLPGVVERTFLLFYFNL